MDRLAPAGPVYQAGTLSGNPLATAAGLATLRAARPEVYAGWTRRPRQWPSWPPTRWPRPGVPFRLQEAGNLFSFFLGTDAPVRDFGEARGQSSAAYAAFFHAHARRRRLPPAVAVRGLVRVCGARRRGIARIAEALPAAAGRAAAALG